MQELVIVEVKRTPQGTTRVKERMAAGKCVMCPTDTEKANAAGRTRHVCEKCRSRLRALKNKLPRKKQAMLEAELIRTGYYLASQEVRYLSHDDHLQRVFEYIAS